ncbi:hypothetical protein [Candidatus Amarobacter glycogenicus]|uniref:hypothetical protein n=1 Tax=Candidatus Amarobacter glycogenicus TaxID=3140699 RepID=UPI0031356235|nr:hypothetical protein [Dehalococcoidia bacterium]
MTDSRQIAGLLGPIIVVVTLSEMVNFDIWEENLAPVTYLNGALLFAAGLAIIRTHNIWKPNWTLLVTLTGWGIGVLGLWRLFFPEADQAGENVAAYLGVGVLCALGCFLTFKGYWPLKPSNGPPN